MRLSKLFKMATFGTFFVTVIIFFVFTIIGNYEEYKKEINYETNKYIQIEKEKLKEKVDLLAEQFEYILKYVNIPEMCKLNNFKKLIENYNKCHKLKYVFIDSEMGEILVHPNEEFLGVDLLQSKNEKLRILKESLIKASHSNNHFIEYELVNPKSNKKEFRLEYIRHIENSPYFIGSGIFLDKEENIKKELKARYFKEFLDSVILFIFIISFLSIVVYVLLKNATNKLDNDLKIFKKFIKEEKIEKNKLYFDEFKDLASKIIEILKEKTKLLKDLEYKTYYDLLTGLPNKLKLEEDLEKLNPIGAMIVDIKNFSLINDYYSTEMGDLVLKEFAKNLKFIIPESCKVYRYSADEFIVLNFGEISCGKIIKKINDNFKQKVMNIKYKNEEIPINIEVIIALVKDKKEIIKKLHLALLYAKKNNLNIVKFNEKMDIEEKIVKKFESIEMVKKALSEDKVVPVFQKILKPDGNSYECLVRIKEKDKLISPFFFLGDIRNTALYYEITKTMIRKSCEFFKDRKEDFSINFLYKDLKNEEIKKYLIEYIKKYNLHNRIIIELLETEAMQDFKDVVKFIKEMKPEGIKIAIDDFGTGYSNFSYLSDIQPNFIKIDGSLVKTIDKNKRYYTIVKHVNAFAHDLGIQTIAEFVHNEEIYKILKEIGIDCFQGYYIAEPKENI